MYLTNDSIYNKTSLKSSRPWRVAEMGLRYQT